MVLGIAQNGISHMGAVHPKLMGAPGDRPQGKETGVDVSLQNRIFRYGRLTGMVYITQKTG